MLAIPTGAATLGACAAAPSGAPSPPACGTSPAAPFLLLPVSTRATAPALCPASLGAAAAVPCRGAVALSRPAADGAADCPVVAELCLRTARMSYCASVMWERGSLSGSERIRAPNFRYLERAGSVVDRVVVHVPPCSPPGDDRRQSGRQQPRQPRQMIIRCTSQRSDAASRPVHRLPTVSVCTATHGRPHRSRARLGSWGLRRRGGSRIRRPAGFSAASTHPWRRRHWLPNGQLLSTCNIASAGSGRALSPRAPGGMPEQQLRKQSYGSICPVAPSARPVFRK